MTADTPGLWFCFDSPAMPRKRIEFPEIRSGGAFRNRLEYSSFWTCIPEVIDSKLHFLSELDVRHIIMPNLKTVNAGRAAWAACPMVGPATTRRSSRSVQALRTPDACQGPEALLAAVRLLKERLSAGLPMEQAVLSTGEEVDPAYRLAVELWFAMDD